MDSSIADITERQVKTVRVTVEVKPPALTGNAKILEDGEEAFRTGKVAAAKEIWSRLLASTDERPVQARAYYGLGRVALAADPKGLISPAVAADPAKKIKAAPEKRGTVVYAIVHAKQAERGFYKSVDGGLNWTKESDYVGGGAAYYCELFVDPNQPDTVWSANTPLDWSKDGGKTWQNVPNMANVLFSAGRGAAAGAVNTEQNQYVHVDFHDVTFDPTNKDHILVSSDGGVHETYDGGLHWRPFMNLPIQQF